MKFEAAILEKRNMLIGGDVEKYEGKDIDVYVYKNSKNSFPNNIKYLEFKYLKNSPVVYLYGDGEMTLEEYSGAIEKYLVLEFDDNVRSTLTGVEQKMLDLNVKMRIDTPQYKW